MSFMSTEVKKELTLLMHPFFLINFIMAGLFLMLKTLPPVCSWLFDDCQLEVREYEILIFLGCVIAFKNKRSISFTGYLATFCMFAKMCNVVMFFRQSPAYAAVYGALWLLLSSFIHKPIYKGPDKVIYFNEDTLEETVLRRGGSDPRTYWLIAFYTAWSPQCVQFAPIFAEVSQEFGLDSLRFGKVDVTRYPAMAERFNVDTSSWSKQLPTVALIRAGKELDRRPASVGAKNKVQRFAYSYDNLVTAFGLTELYNECRKAAPTAPAGDKKKKTTAEKKAD